MKAKIQSVEDQISSTIDTDLDSAQPNQIKLRPLFANKDI